MNAKIKKTPVNNDLNISSEKPEKNRDYEKDRNRDRDRDREERGRNREKDREKEKEKYYNTYEDKNTYEKEKSNSHRTKHSFHNSNYEKPKFKQKDWDDFDMKIDDEEKVSNLQKIMTKFLSEHTIYEAIPEDMKILVFNNSLLIKDSIEAMIKEDIYCGLLWDNKKNDYKGVFTIRDVLEILLVGYEKLLSFLNNNKKIDNYESLTESMDKFLDDFDYMPKKFRARKSIESSGGGMGKGKGLAKGKNINKIYDDNMEIEDENFGNDIDNFKKVVKNLGQFVSLFENITLQNYLDIFKPKDSEEDLVSLYLDANLQDCVNMIRKNGFHRLVVKDKKSSSVSGFITYEAVFEFFVENYYSSMTEFNMPVKYLNVITKNIITLNKKDTLYNCMKTFYEKGISMIPIMDNNDNIFGYFYLKDIIYFFSTGDKFNFNDTIENFLIDLYEDVDDETPYGKKRIVEINDDTNLKQTFEEMSVCPERKLIVHKNQNIGIITLYDIFRELVV